jgi:hypothetical protein
MIVAITTFAMPKPITLEEAQAIFQTTAPKYRNVPGLFRKHYVLSEDGRTVGGIYFWKSKKEAEVVYSEAWRAFVRGKYGTEPSVAYFENPLVVDNVADKIIVEA